MIGQIRNNFEKELKYKLQQKTQPTMALDTSLIKIFKFYDLKNSGSIDKNQFLRAVAKIGIVLENMEASNLLFQAYDSDNDGFINYKDFTNEILGLSNNQQIQQPQVQQQMEVSQQPQQQVRRTLDQSMIQDCLQNMRSQLQKRGQTGLMNFAKSLKNQDTNGKGSLNLNQYNKAVRDSRINLDFHTLDAIFEFFDNNKIGNIVYTDLINALRGDLPKQKEELIVKLFQLFDAQGLYVITIKNLRDRFNPEGHPLVQFNKKQPDEVLLEFFSAIDTFTELRNIRDGKLTLQDFLDFWNFVQFSFLVDQDFYSYFNGVWGLQNIEQQTNQQQYQQQDQSPLNQRQLQQQQQQQFDRSPINQRQQQQLDRSPINQRQQYQDKSPINQRQQQNVYSQQLQYQDKSPINSRYQQQQQNYSPYSQQQSQGNQYQNPQLVQSNLQKLPQQQQQQQQQVYQPDAQSQYSVQQSQKSHLSTTPVKRGAGNQNYSQYNLISGQDSIYQQQYNQKQNYQKQLQSSPLQENQPNFDTISNHSYVSQQSNQQKLNKFVQNPLENVTQRQIQLIMQRVHKRLASRGAKGFLQLQKQFLVSDSDNDGKLNLDEFSFAIQKFRIDVTVGEIQIMFSIFDPQQTKYMEFKEFLKALKGEMNQQRQQIVGQAFAKIDINQNGVVSIYDCFNAYQPRNHPDVKNMKLQEDQVQQDFVETFNLHHQLEGNSQSPDITRDEFISYFTNYSASISDPVHFENIIKSCFNITYESTLKSQHAGGAHQTFDPNCKKGYLQDHHKYMVNGGTVAQNAPFGTFVEQQNQGQRPILYNQQKKPETAQSQQFQRATPIRRKDELDIFGGYGQAQNQQSQKIKTEESTQEIYQQQQNQYQNQQQQVRQSMPQKQFNNFMQDSQQQNQQQQQEEAQQQQQQYSQQQYNYQQQQQNQLQQQKDQNIYLQNQLNQMTINDNLQNEQQNQQQQLQLQQEQQLQQEEQQYQQQQCQQQQQQVQQSNENPIITQLRQKLALRETRGFLNLLRQFKIKDLMLSGQLNYQEFVESFTDLRIEVEQQDLNNLFQQFSTQQNTIVYEQFFEILVGDVSEFRKDLIFKAFQGLDYERQGEIDIEDVKNLFYAQGHPDIQQGVSTEQEIRAKFNDSLEFYFNLCVPIDSQKNGKFSYFDFSELYKIISATIKSDNRFEQYMVNCWQLNKFNVQQQ